jgi:hypothetical protein
MVATLPPLRAAFGGHDTPHRIMRSAGTAAPERRVELCGGFVPCRAWPSKAQPCPPTVSGHTSNAWSMPSQRSTPHASTCLDTSTAFAPHLRDPEHDFSFVCVLIARNTCHAVDHMPPWNMGAKHVRCDSPCGLRWQARGASGLSTLWHEPERSTVTWPWQRRRILQAVLLTFLKAVLLRMGGLKVLLL